MAFQVQVAEFNETTSFRDQLAAVSSAGVYVSVHTSNLANSPFLRPGAAVVEVIQRNWMYHGLDQSFQVPFVLASQFATLLHTAVASKLCVQPTISAEIPDSMAQFPQGLEDS